MRVSAFPINKRTSFHLESLVVALKMERTFRTCDMVLAFAGIRIFSKTNWDSKLWFIIQILCSAVAFSAVIFTTGFIIQNISETVVLLKGASIWSTSVIPSMSLLILLFYKKEFRQFLSEVAFVDMMFEMPLIPLSVQFHKSGTILHDLRILVLHSRKKILNFTRILMIVYAFIVIFNAQLYLFDAVYRMIMRKDPDERLFGK